MYTRFQYYVSTFNTWRNDSKQSQEVKNILKDFNDTTVEDTKTSLPAEDENHLNHPTLQDPVPPTEVPAPVSTTEAANSNSSDEEFIIVDLQSLAKQDSLQSTESNKGN